MASAKAPKACILFSFRPRYRAFDLSGAWEFAIDYYLVLGQSENKLNQGFALKVSTQESLLDLPFALKQGYLVIRDLDEDEEPLIFGNNFDLDAEHRPQQSVIIPHRTSPGPGYRDWIKLSTAINPNGQIAAKLTPFHRHRLEVTELGLSSSVKWCKPVRCEAHNMSSTSTSSLTAEVPQGDEICISWFKRSTGKLDFKALSSLRQPPYIQVTLIATSPLEFKENDDLHFRVEIVNRSDQAVTVLHTGHHRYLSATELVRPKRDCEHKRITANEKDIEHYSCSVLNSKTRQELISHTEASCHLRLDYNKPPHRDRFSTLQPHVPLIKRGSLRNHLFSSTDLKAGEEYELSIPPLGADWFWGTIEETFGSKDRANPPWKPLETPPVMLASENKITFKIIS